MLQFVPVVPELDAELEAELDAELGDELGEDPVGRQQRLMAMLGMHVVPDATKNHDAHMPPAAAEDGAAEHVSAVEVETFTVRG